MKKTLAIAALASLAMASNINDFHDNNLDVIKDLQRVLKNPKIAKDTAGKLLGLDDFEIENELHALKELTAEAKKAGKNPGLFVKTLGKLLGKDDYEFDNEFNAKTAGNVDIIKNTVGKLFGYDDIDNEFNVVEDAKRVKNNPNIITNTIGKLFGYDDIEFDNEFNVVGDAKRVVNPDIIKKTVGKLFGYDDLEFDNEFNVKSAGNVDIIKNTVGKLFGYDDIDNELSLATDLIKIVNHPDVIRKLDEYERRKLLFDDDEYNAYIALKDLIKKAPKKEIKIPKVKGYINFDDEDNELAVLRDLIHEAKQIQQENIREKKHFRGIDYHLQQEDLENDNYLYKIPPVKIKRN